MDYYDKTGDLLYQYLHIRENDTEVVESKNILSFLCKKKEVDENKPKSTVNKTVLFETDAGADAQVLVDTLNGGFNLQVLPPAVTTTNWSAQISYIKVI